MKRKVNEITLTTADMRKIEQYLMENCGLDSLDLAELLLFMEELKEVSINI